MSDPFGFLNINKPQGLTSHDVISRLRRSLKVRKAGHAGTLDPLATGVLVVCIGAATRLSEYVMQSLKRYQAVLRLGISTDTYDAEGRILRQRDISPVTRKAIARLLPVFEGDIEQVPPMYSAIKQGGRKLYELARAGETVERPPRPVRIDQLTLMDWTPPLLTLDVLCSPGTYIRSLAHDLGEALGVGAHLAALERTASGSFTIEEALSLDDLENTPDWRGALVPVDRALAHLPALRLNAQDANHVLHGRSIGGDTALGDFARAYGPDDRFIAILKAAGPLWRPHKVFHPEA